MNPINSLTPKALRKAADIQERILRLHNELNQLLGASAPIDGAPAPKKRKMSAAGRAAIAAAVRARWAKLKRSTPKNALAKPEKKMSTAGRARLSAIAKARWKKVKAAGKARL